MQQQEDNQTSEVLGQKWRSNTEQIINSSNAQYKVDKDKFLGKGAFGVVYGAIRKYPIKPKKESEDIRYEYQRVVIKQFKKSQKWTSEDDWDHELLIMKKFMNDFHQNNWQNVLQVIDIFQFDNRKYYFVTKWAKGGNLCEIIKTNLKQSEIFQFAQRSAKILQYLHYESLKQYQSKQKDSSPKQSIGIIHRDFKPANLVFIEKGKMKTMYLIDFGIAKIGYSNLEKHYSNCGTANYKAPEINQKKYNAKVDIYSFGCTLYQIFTNGEKLLGRKGLDLSDGRRDQYIRGKLIDLENKLLKMNEKNQKNIQNGRQDRVMKNPLMWIQILNKCLEMNPKDRWNSKELSTYLQKAKAKGFQTKKAEKVYYFSDLPLDYRQFRKKRDMFQLNFQLYRVNAIQDIVFQIFEYYYFQQPRLSKFVLYVCMKYISIYLLQKYQKVKSKAKLWDKADKQALLKKLIDQKKINEIKKKSHQKLKNELSKEVDSKSNNQQKGPIQQITSMNPELLLQNNYQPRKTLFEFCYKKEKEIVSNQKFGNLMGIAIMMTDDLDAYPDIDIDIKDCSMEIELLTLKKLFKFKEQEQKKLNEQGLSGLYKALRIQNSIRTHMNRDQIKTDIQIEKKK